MRDFVIGIWIWDVCCIDGFVFLWLVRLLRGKEKGSKGCGFFLKFFGSGWLDVNRLGLDKIVGFEQGDKNWDNKGDWFHAKQNSELDFTRRFTKRFSMRKDSNFHFLIIFITILLESCLNISLQNWGLSPCSRCGTKKEKYKAKIKKITSTQINKKYRLQPTETTRTVALFGCLHHTACDIHDDSYFAGLPKTLLASLCVYLQLQQCRLCQVIRSSCISGF